MFGIKLSLDEYRNIGINNMSIFLYFFSKFNKKHFSSALYNSSQESYYNITREVVKDILLCDQKRCHTCINSSQCNFKLWYELNDKLNRLETEYAKSNNF